MDNRYSQGTIEKETIVNTWGYVKTHIWNGEMTLAAYTYLFFTKYKNIFLRRRNMVESREPQLHIIPGN